MKKIIIFFIIAALAIPQSVFAVDEEEVNAPKWEDYIPEKYQNPRTDFKRKTAYLEMATGFFLTDIIITSPIGIPILVHSFTKIKNISYSDKKKKFEQGLKFAEQINDPEQKKAYYKTLLKECKMTERRKNKLAKKRAKKRLKEERKAKKSLEPKI